MKKVTLFLLALLLACAATLVCGCSVALTAPAGPYDQIYRRIATSDSAWVIAGDSLYYLKAGKIDTVDVFYIWHAYQPRPQWLLRDNRPWPPTTQ